MLPRSESLVSLIHDFVIDDSNAFVAWIYITQEIFQEQNTAHQFLLYQESSPRFHVFIKSFNPLRVHSHVNDEIMLKQTYFTTSRNSCISPHFYTRSVELVYC